MLTKELTNGMHAMAPMQRLAAEHDLLRGVVETTKARINANDPNIFSLSGVYDGLKRYDLGMVLPRGRSPKAKSVEELVSLGTELFNLVGSARPEFKDVKDAIANADPNDLGETMRGKRRSTLLLSTTTLRVIAGALNEAMKEDGETDVSL